MPALDGTRHSEKPAEVRAIIEKMHPDASRIELFAREWTPGWDAWGDELPARPPESPPCLSGHLTEPETGEPDRP
jgi:hypothetical protein